MVCVVCFSAAFFLWKAALFGSGQNESGEEPFRPVVGDPPYRVCIDAGHGGSDPGARGVVEEKEMTAQTSEALFALLEADPKMCIRDRFLTSVITVIAALVSGWKNNSFTKEAIEADKVYDKLVASRKRGD